MYNSKTKVYLIIFSILFFTMYSTNESKASDADTGLGLTGYYAFWKPAFDGAYTDGMDLQPDFLWGPVITVSFLDNWTIGFVFLQNLTSGFDGEWGYSGKSYSGYDYSFKEEGKMKRGDIDLSLTYKINQYFKVFTGLKYYIYGNSSGTTYQSYSYTGYAYSLSGSDIWGTNEFSGFGCAAGFTVQYPFTDSFYITMNNSFIYFFKNYLYWDYPKPPTASHDAYDMSENTWTEVETSGTAYGFNTQLSLSYFFSSADTALVIGGRFQFLKFDIKDINMKNDIVYGPTISVVKYF